MSRVLAVAWRDFKATAMTKAFIFAVLGVPILIIGAMALAGVIMATHKAPPLVGTVALVADEAVIEKAKAEFDRKRIEADDRKELDEAEQSTGAMMGGGPGGMGGMGGQGMSALARGDVRIEIEAHPLPADGAAEAEIESLKERVRRGELLALAVVTPAVLETPDPQSPWAERPRFDLYVAEGVENDHVGLIEDRVAKAIVKVRFERQGLDPETALAMMSEPAPSTRRILSAGGETQENELARELKTMLVPMAFMMLLWIATFTAGQHLMMSTIEEKSNKVMEVLLSAVSPLQLMTGKILGQGAVGLIIVGVYSSVGLVSLFALSQMRLIEPLQLVYLAVYFFMAYFMVASLMAAVGSAVSDIREANSLLTPVMLILMIPLLLWMPISQAPNGGIAVAFSFIPPAIPFAMILRATAEEPVPGWQILATMVWGYICVLIMVWTAAKIFRVGVLMYGKPPTPIELIRWLRYS